jgi:hypothetical protein
VQAWQAVSTNCLGGADSASVLPRHGRATGLRLQQVPMRQVEEWGFDDDIGGTAEAVANNQRCVPTLTSVAGVEVGNLRFAGGRAGLWHRTTGSHLALLTDSGRRFRVTVPSIYVD